MNTSYYELQIFIYHTQPQSKLIFIVLCLSYHFSYPSKFKSYHLNIISMYLFIILVAVITCSQIEGQQSLAVTIYNNDFAMVKDVRNIRFDKGESVLYFTDVSSNIQTETVTFKALENPETIRVYEQNFEKNLVNQDGILKRYINREIQIVAQFGDSVKRIRGTLLSHGSNFIIQTPDNKVIIAQKVTAIDLPSLPEGFFTLPTLNWKVWSEKQQTTSCQVAYRTTGFSWKSDYTIVLDKTDKKGDIGGWVTIDNNSGKKYENAKLKLIAGDVNLVSNQIIPTYRLYAKTTAAAPNAPEFSQKSFADYHLYTLSAPVTLNESSQKQVEFIPKVYGVPIRKFNQIAINAGGYGRQNIKASNKIEFINSKESGLGIPFPKGTIRAFKEDSDDGSLEFIGEDSIDHTPKDENITIVIGNSFDVTSDLYAQNRRTFSNNGYEANMNLTINNHKEQQVEIVVIYNTYYGDNLGIRWNESNKAKLEKMNANKYRVTMKLKADEEVALKWNERYSP